MAGTGASKKSRKHGRSLRSAAHARYKAENRRDKNKAAKAVKQAKKEAKAKAKKEAREAAK